MEFKDRLKQLRSDANLTQEQLAERSGVSIWTLRGYEQGNRQPKWQILALLAKGLGVPMDVFRDSLPSSPLETVAIPLVGRVAAGPGCLEELHDTIDLGVMFADCVAFQVVGSSMTDESIESGDYIIVRKNDSPPAGSIVVAWIEGSGGVVKRFDGRGFLRSTGKDRWSHKLDRDQGDRILGILVGVVRKS